MDTHYHYIVKFHPSYVKYIEKIKKRLTSCFGSCIGDHKLIKNKEHHDNIVRYLDKYNDIEEDPYLNDVTILSSDDGETILISEPKSGPATSYIYDSSDPEDLDNQLLISAEKN